MERNQIIPETVATESIRLLCPGGNITNFEQTLIPYVRYQYARVLKFITKTETDPEFATGGGADPLARGAFSEKKKFVKLRECWAHRRGHMINIHGHMSKCGCIDIDNPSVEGSVKTVYDFGIHDN